MKILFTTIFIAIGFTTTIIVPRDIEALASQKISYDNDQGRHMYFLHHVSERNVDSNLTSEEIPQPITFNLYPDQFSNNTEKGSFKDSQPMSSYNTKVRIEHSDWQELKSSKSSEDPSNLIQTKYLQGRLPPVRSLHVVTLHENDLQVVQDFHQRLRVLFRKLLVCARVDGLRVHKVSEMQTELEGLFRSLWSDLKQINSFGNLFRSQIAHVFEKARSLFELLQYHESLELRYGKLQNISVDNQEQGTCYSSDEIWIGYFSLKLVKYELSLFRFLSDDGSFQSGTVDYDEKLHNSEFQFQNLMQEYENLIHVDIPYSKMFGKEIQRLTGVLQQMQLDSGVRHIFQIYSCPSKAPETCEGSQNILLPQKGQLFEIQELTTKGTEDLLEMVEQKLNIMEDLLVKYNYTSELDLELYLSCKESVLEIRSKLERSIVPSQSQVKVEIVLSDTFAKVYCMDQEIACGKLDSCFNRQFSSFFCSSFSFMKYMNNIRALDHSVENLLYKIRSWAGSSEHSDVLLHASEIKEAKFLHQALQKIDSSIWTGIPDLVASGHLMDQISVNIRKLEAILSDIETNSDLRVVELGAVDIKFKDAKAEEDIICDDTSKIFVEEKLQKIEYALNEYSNPKTQNIDLKKHIEEKRAQFDDVMTTSRRTIICSTRLSFQAERISSLIQMLEEALAERQSERPQRIWNQ